MICRSPAASSRNSSGRADALRGPDRDSPGEETLYGPSFWQTYVANTLFSVAVAILFRYADFVTCLGGTELHLGWIVGVGMVGSLAMRLFVGAGIDRYGPGLVWLWSLVVFALSCFAHLAIGSYHGPSIYLARVVYCSAIAGVYGSSMTLVSGRAPVVRIAEMLGMLGTSGFVGVVLGTMVADGLCGAHAVSRWQVDQMFLVAGALALTAMGFAWPAARGASRPARRRQAPMLWIVKRYQPGVLLAVGVALGVGLGLPSTFLRTFAAELHVTRISLFFIVYAPLAIITRVVARRMPERFGLPPMILLGQGILVLSLAMLAFVRSEWQFVLPGITYGIAHAILFPTTVAAGSGVFPTRYRGLGMTVMLAAYDLGLLIGSPTAGAIVHYSSLLGLPPYPTMFLAMAAMLAAVGLVYGISRRQAKPPHRPGHAPAAGQSTRPRKKRKAVRIGRP